MNANELADKLQKEKPNTLMYVAVIADAATMLRQQQAEIEVLKAELRLIDELVAGKDESFDRTASHMAGEYVFYNEPVAWIDTKELDMDVSTSVTKHKQFDTDIPLYTHPAKTLTDEEILIEAKYQLIYGYYFACEYDVLNFARAILQRASEK